MNARNFVLSADKDDVLLTHERQLWQARFSPSGEFLIGCGYDATIQRWAIGIETQALMAPMLGHNGWVQSFDFHPTNGQLFSADSWGQLKCWTYGDEQPQTLWANESAHDGWIRAVAASPDGSVVATGGNGNAVRLWSADNGEMVQELAHSKRVFSLRFHPRLGELISGDLEGVVRHWDLESGKEVRQFDASVLYAHEVERERIQHCGGARHLQFNESGTQFVCAGQMNPEGGFAKGTPCVLVFDWDEGTLIRQMPMGGVQDGFAYDASFHRDGFVMATSCAFPKKGHVWFWHPDDEEAFFSSNKLPNGRSLSLHPDGQRVAFLTSDSRNGNGRPLKDGQYEGGIAGIRVMRMTESAAEK